MQYITFAIALFEEAKKNIYLLFLLFEVIEPPNAHLCFFDCARRFLHYGLREFRVLENLKCSVLSIIYI